jgi:hypothetical protein
MKTLSSLGVLSLAGTIALVACADDGLVAPSTSESLGFEDEIALDMLRDPETVESALATVEIDLAGADRIGVDEGGRILATQLASEARVRFQDAGTALSDGQRGRAAIEAREARRLVARAAETARGARMADAFVERIEDLQALVGDAPEAYDDAPGLASELGRLAATARDALAAGDRARAGGLGVLAEQRHRHRARRFTDVDTRFARARLAVALGGAAVGLAGRILEEQGADQEQLRFLVAAKEYLRAAELALEDGTARRAVHLAELAQWSALKALVLPGGVTMEEARAMERLAIGMYERAITALGDDVSPLQAELLEHARRHIAHGQRLLAGGYVRGVAALWRAAVACRWLLS